MAFTIINGDQTFFGVNTDSISFLYRMNAQGLNNEPIYEIALSFTNGKCSYICFHDNNLRDDFFKKFMTDMAHGQVLPEYTATGMYNYGAPISDAVRVRGINGNPVEINTTNVVKIGGHDDYPLPIENKIVFGSAARDSFTVYLEQ